MGMSWGYEGKVVLVTGVGRAGQIGHSVAQAFGKAGARLVATDRNAVGLAERVKEFAAQGIEAKPAAGDLTEPDVAALTVETALKHYGRLDAVINVAGGLTTYGPIAKYGVDAFDREISINLKTTYLVITRGSGGPECEAKAPSSTLLRSPTTARKIRWRSTARRKPASLD